MFIYTFFRLPLPENSIPFALEFSLKNIFSLMNIYDQLFFVVIIICIVFYLFNQFFVFHVNFWPETDGSLSKIHGSRLDLHIFQMNYNFLYTFSKYVHGFRIIVQHHRGFRLKIIEFKTNKFEKYCFWINQALNYTHNIFYYHTFRLANYIYYIILFYFNIWKHFIWWYFQFMIHRNFIQII